MDLWSGPIDFNILRVMHWHLNNTGWGGHENSYIRYLCTDKLIWSWWYVGTIAIAVTEGSWIWLLFFIQNAYFWILFFFHIPRSLQLEIIIIQQAKEESGKGGNTMKCYFSYINVKPVASQYRRSGPEPKDSWKRRIKVFACKIPY